MSSIRIIFIVFFVTFSGASHAWNPFGPKNYEDCILKGMKGVTNDLAARGVAQACRSKFPESSSECRAVELSSKEKANVSVKIHVTDYGYLKGTVFNGNSVLSIKNMSIKLSAKNISPPQVYKMIYTGPYTQSVSPNSVEEIFAKIQEAPEGNWEATIESVKGCIEK
jgi:hypothetical protein